MPLIQENAQCGSNKLADDGSIGGAFNPHGGQPAQAEDHNGIEDNIDDSTYALDVHGDKGLAGSLQHTLGSNFHKDADGTDADNGEVFCTILGYEGGNPFLHGEVEMGAKGPEQCKYDCGADGKQQAHIGYFFRPFAVLLPQSTGKQGIHTNTGAGGKGNHEVLNGEGQRYGSEGIFADAGNKNAIYNIIESLNKHGDNER